MSPTINKPIIQLKNIYFRVNNRLILENINLSVNQGEIVSIIGPNGAGKTTLLKIMIGLLLPTSGEVIRSESIQIGYMPQRLHIEKLFPLTVKRFLQLGLKGVDIKSLCEELGISSLFGSQLSSLSGGELQRVLLARAILRQPNLLVLDEPAQGIDLMGQGELYDLISKIRDRNECAILLVSHDLNIVMAKTDNVICLNQHICCSGHPEKVSKDPAFAEMFGHIDSRLAVYTHNHDHHHEPLGSIVPSEKKKHE